MIEMLLGLITLVLCVVMYSVGYRWAKRRNLAVPASYGYAALAVVGIVASVLIALVKHFRYHH
jgi:hypothetical protein